MQYVLLYIGESCDPLNKLYYCDLSLLPKGLEGCRGTREFLPFAKLVDNFYARYHYVANDEAVFTFLTNKDAPRYKLVRVDLKEPNSWTEVLQEDKMNVLESVSAVRGNLILVNYLSDVKNVLQIRDLRTGDLLHHLPVDIGSVSEISARRKDSIIFIGFTSFLVPGIIYVCKLEGNVPDMKIFRETVVPSFDRTEFEVNQVNSCLIIQLSHVVNDKETTCLCILEPTSRIPSTSPPQKLNKFADNISWPLSLESN